MSRIEALYKYKCPKCEEGSVYQENKYWSLGKMHEFCSNCHHKFEQEPGFFFGAMFVSYGLTFPLGIAIYVLSQFLFNDMTIFLSVALIALALLVFAPINFKLSRVIWMYINTSKP